MSNRCTNSRCPAHLESQGVSCTSPTTTCCLSSLRLFSERLLSQDGEVENHDVTTSETVLHKRTSVVALSSDLYSVCPTSSLDFSLPLNVPFEFEHRMCFCDHVNIFDRFHDVFVCSSLEGSFGLMTVVFSCMCLCFMLVWV